MEEVRPEVTIPESVAEAHRGWTFVHAYQLVPEVVTWRLTHPSGERRFLKVARRRLFPGLEAEAARMRWARPRLAVPQVLEYGRGEDTEWLLTAALAGRDATHPSLSSQPERLARILGTALRRFHEAGTRDCPFDTRLAVALPHVRRRVKAGIVDAETDLHPEFSHLTAEQALAVLERDRPAGEDVVVCHGDYCLPNVIVDGDSASGCVDLGELGLADRWWDLAVGTWSVTWNLGPGWEAAFLDAYGIKPDQERMAYYRLLYDLYS